MNQKIIKRLLIIVTLILFLFAIYKVLSIYGVFYSEANGVLNQKQSNWIIKLNDKIVSNGINENFSINIFESN